MDIPGMKHGYTRYTTWVYQVFNIVAVTHYYCVVRMLHSNVMTRPLRIKGYNLPAQ